MRPWRRKGDGEEAGSWQRNGGNHFVPAVGGLRCGGGGPIDVDMHVAGPGDTTGGGVSGWSDVIVKPKASLGGFRSFHSVGVEENRRVVLCLHIEPGQRERVQRRNRRGASCAEHELGDGGRLQVGGGIPVGVEPYGKEPYQSDTRERKDADGENDFHEAECSAPFVTDCPRAGAPAVPAGEAK